MNEDLRIWFKEKWVDISKKDSSGNHPPCGRPKSKKKGYPKCRPSRKVSSKTPETSGEMTKEQKQKATSQKRRAEAKPREGKKPNVVSHHDIKDAADYILIGKELLLEKNRPTNPKLWSRAKAKAKAKFKVYPSAYANGWASKWYKEQGGGWESVNESFAKTFAGALAVGGALGFAEPQSPQETQKSITVNPLVANTTSQKELKHKEDAPKYHHDIIKQMVIQDEGFKNKPYKDTKGILTVGIGHNLEAPASKESFKRAFGDRGHILHKSVSSGSSMTSDQVKQLFDADYDEHLNRTVKMIPNLHVHPPEVQAVLVSGVYRGHVGDSPTFRRLFNQGDYHSAAREFLNRKEYRDKKTPKGVINRLNRDQQVLQKYADSMK
jgi:GH24 family phage-related lysozyme (muramidase)